MQAMVSRALFLGATRGRTRQPTLLPRPSSSRLAHAFRHPTPRTYANNVSGHVRLALVKSYVASTHARSDRVLNCDHPLSRSTTQARQAATRARSLYAPTPTHAPCYPYHLHHYHHHHDKEQPAVLALPNFSSSWPCSLLSIPATPLSFLLRRLRLRRLLHQEEVPSLPSAPPPSPPPRPPSPFPPCTTSI